jgi:hypothetical protein
VKGASVKAASTLSAAAFVGLLALAGCSSTGRTAGTSVGSATTANQAPITVTTVSPATAVSTGSDSDQLSVVESDLTGVDSASAQADTDTSAADSAQATSDSP